MSVFIRYPQDIYYTIFQVYMYSLVILLIVLYDGAVMVQITLYMDDNVTTIRDDDDVVMMLLSVLYVGYYNE